MTYRTLSQSDFSVEVLGPRWLFHAGPVAAYLPIALNHAAPAIRQAPAAKAKAPAAPKAKPPTVIGLPKDIWFEYIEGYAPSGTTETTLQTSVFYRVDWAHGKPGRLTLTSSVGGTAPLTVHAGGAYQNLPGMMGIALHAQDLAAGKYTDVIRLHNALNPKDAPSIRVHLLVHPETYTGTFSGTGSATGEDPVGVFGTAHITAHHGQITGTVSGTAGDFGDSFDISGTKLTFSAGPIVAHSALRGQIQYRGPFSGGWSANGDGYAGSGSFTFTPDEYPVGFMGMA